MAAPPSTRIVDSSMSPTMTSPAIVTGANVLMGTAAYMAPEQARGKPVDKRVDIWAFGVVLYEMLTGTRAFEGETVTEVAGAVIHKELDLGKLPAETPESVRLVLRRCLQKDPKQRIRDMGDVRLMLDGAFAAPVRSARTVTTAFLHRGLRSHRWRRTRSRFGGRCGLAFLAPGASLTLKCLRHCADTISRHHRTSHSVALSERSLSRVRRARQPRESTLGALVR